MKPLGDQGFDSLDTSFQIKDCVAFLAVKVMMVPKVGTLVAGGLSLNLYATNLPFFREGFQGAVDGGNSQRRNSLEGKGMNLVRQQGA